MKPTLKILVHSMYYSPELIGIGLYVSEMCEWLASQGHSVRVISAPPHYPGWKVMPPYSNWYKAAELINGVEVTRCPAFIPTEPKGLKRALYYFSFGLLSFPVMCSMIFWRPEVVFVIEPPITNTLGALLLAKLGRSLAWLHVQDFEVDIAFDLKLIKSPLARSLIHKLESALMRRFNRVSTISAAMLNRLRDNKGLPATRCVLFPNWVDPNMVYPLSGVSSMRAELDISPDQIVALFSGTLGTKQNVELLIEAAKRLSDQGPGIFVIICGDGDAVPRLKELARGLNNVRFLPLQPLERKNDLLCMADIHLLPQQKSAADLVMPSKLLGMLASGRPVIATADLGTEVAALVAQCGIVVSPGDAEALSTAVRELANNPKLRSSLGARAREIAVDRLSKDVILRNFQSTLLTAIGRYNRTYAAVASE